MKNGTLLSANVQDRIGPTPTPLIKVELEEFNTTQIIKVKIRKKASQATPETYKMNMSTFDYGQ